MAVGGGGGGGSSGIRAGRAFVELFSKDNMLYRGLARAQKAVETFGKYTAGIGGVALGAGGAVLGTVAALFQRVAEKRKGLTADEGGRLAMGADAIKSAWEGVETIFGRVVAALLPSRETIGLLYEAAMNGVAVTRDWIDANAGLIRTVVLGAAALAAAGAALIAIGAAAGAAATGIGVAVAAVKLLASGLLLLTTPAGLAVAAVAGLGYLFATQTETGKKWASAIGGYFQSVAGTAVEAWGGIVDAIKAGDLALAGRIALAALNVEWRRGMVGLTVAWTGFKGFFVDSWHAGVAGLQKAWVNLTAALESLWVRFVQKTKFEWKGVGPFVTDVMGHAFELIKKAWAASIEANLQVLKLAGMAVGVAFGASFEAAMTNAKFANKAADAAAKTFVLEVIKADDPNRLAEIEQERKAAIDRISDAERAALDARRAGRADAIAIAESELFKAQADLAAMVAQAKAAANLPKKKGGDGLSELFATARVAGQFGGANAGQVFGASQVSPIVAKLDEGNKVQVQVRDAIIELREKLGIPLLG